LDALLAALAGSDPSARVELADCRRGLAHRLSTTGKSGEALAVYRQAEAGEEAPAAAPGAGDHARSELARTVTSIAYLLTNTGKARDAAEYRKALAILEGLADAHPDAEEYRDRSWSGPLWSRQLRRRSGSKDRALSDCEAPRRGKFRPGLPGARRRAADRASYG
jgi:hypothetical protein